MRARTRGLAIVAFVVLAILATSCSGATGSGSSKSSRAGACTYVAKLDVIANTVAAADVRDPDTFKKTMASAVHDYVTNLSALRAVAPPELGAGLDRVAADVKQYRFDAALTDRAALDSYAARTCGRALQSLTTTTGAAPSATSAPTTTAAGDTTTTVASDTTSTVASDSTTSTSSSGG